MKATGIRTVLVLGSLVLLCLPFAAVTALRIPESELVRRTEQALISQGAVVAAAYRVALGRAVDDGRIAPVVPETDVIEAEVLPPLGRAPPVPGPSTPESRAAGATVQPTMKLAQRVTLAAIRVVNGSGTVVASTLDGEVGRTLAHRPEVSAALQGRAHSLLRRRHTDNDRPDLDSPSRRSDVRVHLALPIVDQGETLGAVVLSRTPLSLTKVMYQHRTPLIWAGAVAVLLALGLAWIAAFRIGDPIRGLQARSDYLATFASHVSHAFKTPLTSIRGAVELLRDHGDRMTEAERERFLAMLTSDAERMGRLVDRLLELARADEPTVDGTSSDAPALLERLARRYEADGLPVSLTHGDAVGRVAVAPEILESILCVLLDNARQHGGDDVRVTVETERGRAGAIVRIGDDGPGVPPAARETIFDPFVTTASDRGGSGLGLAIARKLAAAHGGRLGLEASPAGARFALQLPHAMPQE